MKRIGIYVTSILLILTVILTIFLIYAYFEEQKPSQPTQPSSGPGGSEYQYGNVNVTNYGEGENQYWIFEPNSPKPSSAPVIVFLHGWGATTPTFYRAWINHLVREGNIVIYPRYQQDLSTPSDNFTPNSIKAVKDAIIVLQSGNHVRPQLDKFALVGHSVGGLLSVNMASLASSQGLPQPKAVFAVEPGKSRSKTDTVGPILENLTIIPSNTLLLTMAGDEDNWVGDDDAKKIIRETTQISSENKDFILMKTDNHGYPSLIADHFAPLAPEVNLGSYNLTFLVNSMDYGTWKLFDGLYQKAFNGTNGEYALGNTDQQKYMGLWGDKTPVKELLINNNP